MEVTPPVVSAAAQKVRLRALRRLHPAWEVVKAAARAYRADNAMTRAAALAYYTVFSIAPSLVIAIAVAGSLVGRRAARGELALQLHSAVGETAARAVQQLVAGTASAEQGGLATLVSIVVLFLAATGVFAELQNALNVFWKASPARAHGVLAFLRQRGIAIVMVLALGLVLLASLLFTATLAVIAGWVAEGADARATVVLVVDPVVSGIVVTVLLAVVFRSLPACTVAWSDVWAGALATSLLLTVGKLVVAVYLGHTAVGSISSAAGAVVLLLAWVYYSCLALFFGAELTQVVGHRRASKNRARP